MPKHKTPLLRAESVLSEPNSVSSDNRISIITPTFNNRSHLGGRFYIIGNGYQAVIISGIRPHLFFNLFIQDFRIAAFVFYHFRKGRNFPQNGVWRVAFFKHRPHFPLEKQKPFVFGMLGQCQLNMFRSRYWVTKKTHQRFMKREFSLNRRLT